ncbi:MAG: MauE/DoxX family redox-associated membrane protein [Ignavibacteria bacterium]
MKFLSNKYFLIALRIIVGGIFIYASLDKLLNQEMFSKAIYNYKFLPGIFINFFAITIPYIELIAGIFLISGIFKRGSSLIISILLILFIVALVQAYARGLDINCACFELKKELENADQKSDILLRIIEDFLLLAASVIIFIKSKTIITKEIHQ